MAKLQAELAPRELVHPAPKGASHRNVDCVNNRTRPSGAAQSGTVSDEAGPQRRWQHRDWRLSVWARKIRWNKDRALESLWNHKRQPVGEVETFSRDDSPRR